MASPEVLTQWVFSREESRSPDVAGISEAGWGSERPSLTTLCNQARGMFRRGMPLWCSWAPFLSLEQSPLFFFPWQRQRVAFRTEGAYDSWREEPPAQKRLLGSGFFCRRHCLWCFTFCLGVRCEREDKQSEDPVWAGGGVLVPCGKMLLCRAAGHRRWT